MGALYSVAGGNNFFDIKKTFYVNFCHKMLKMQKKQKKHVKKGGRPKHW